MKKQLKTLEIVFPKKKQAKLIEYTDPPLGKTQLRGRTLATCISTGSEIAAYKGLSVQKEFPMHLNNAGCVFEVEETGKDVTSFKKGEHVFCFEGGHRSSQQIDVKDTIKVPENLSPKKAVLARLMGIPMTTLMTTKSRPGDLVVVCGVGPVGFLAAHLFHISGYDVAVVEPNSLRRKQIEESGISKTFKNIPVKDPHFLGKVALVIDCSGDEKSILDGCQVVRKLGEVVLVGTPWERKSDIFAHEIIKNIFFNFVILRSGWEHEIPMQSTGFPEDRFHYNNAPQTVFSGFAKALKWLSEEKIPLEGLVINKYPYTPDELYKSISLNEIEELFIVMDWTKFN